MSTPPTLSDRYRYAFDTLMARGPYMLLGWQVFAVITTVVLISVVVVVLGMMPVDENGDPIGFAALVWLTLMHAIDPGTITGDESAPAWRAVMMTTTVLGILLIGSLVAVLVASVSQRFDSLRRGRSRVLEEDHTLILGWSRQIFTIVSELAVAHANKPHCVVICAEHEKLWMEEELRTKITQAGKHGRLRLVIRSGDPTDPDTLSQVAIEQAHAIVVLDSESSPNDTQVLRTLLAIGRRTPDEGYRQHVVTELDDPRNVAVAQLTGDRRIEALVVGDLIAKITVQTCLQSGLSVVYEELLGFEGSEMYFVDAGALVGQTFAQAVQQPEDVSVMGICSAAGQIRIKPPLDSKIGPGDRLIVISVDEHWQPSSWAGTIDESAIAERKPTVRQPERTLILGWNERVPAIVTGIDAYVAPGSEVCVVALDPSVRLELGELSERLQNVKLEHRHGDVSDRRVLDALDPNTWHHVLVLPPDRLEVATEADAQVLVALLHLRDIAEVSNRPFSVVSEMRDARSRDLAEAARADDFIISDRFIGLVLAQVAENPDLAAVFSDLFDPEGVEIYLRPASDYVVLERDLDYHTLIEAGLRRDELVLGYRRAADAMDPRKDFGVVLNPPKSGRIELHAGDRVIVLAES
jgi:voltage-gated potassium channel Kch